MHLVGNVVAVPSQGQGSQNFKTELAPASSHLLKRMNRTKREGSLSPVVMRLLCAGIIFSLFFAYLFLYVHIQHDPVWSRRRMMDDRKVEFLAVSHPRARVEKTNGGILGGQIPDPEMQGGEPIVSLGNFNKDEELRKRYSLPVNGSAFLADYDVAAIRPLDDPPLSKEHPEYKFKYGRNSSKYTIHYLSAQPMVGWIPNFMSDRECDAIVAEALKTMKRSQVVPYKDARDQTTVSQVRTSSQTWLSTDDPAAKSVVDRILDLTGFPQGSAEMLQVLRYEPGQKYDAHLDYFDPKLYGKQTSNRALTAYLYLSTVEEGGYTQFPRANGKPPTWDFTSCSAGLKVKPVKGTLAIFYDMKPNGEFDDYSLHGACKLCGCVYRHYDDARSRKFSQFLFN